MKNKSSLSVLVSPFTDPTAWSIVFSNLLIIALAVRQDWSVGEMLWIYWAQSIVIGVFTIVKMLLSAHDGIDALGLKKLGTPGVIAEKTISIAGKLFLSGFYVVHYGAFHLGYAIFLSAMFGTVGSFNPFGENVPSLDPAPIVIATALFFVTHLFSFAYNWTKDLKKDPGEIMTGSYIRIIPMHITIIFGGMLMMMGMPKGTLILFMLLKTGMDVAMHNAEHKRSA